MATPTIGSPYSPPSTAGHLTDTISPIYPDRPIRPLPKRRLRSRLSPELANSILYPKTSRSSKPLFHLPFTESLSLATESANVNGTGGTLLSELDHSQVNRARDAKNGYHFKGNDLDSDEEDGIGILRRYQQQRQVAPPLQRTLPNGLGRPEFPKHVKPTAPQSTVSSVDSVDGYDSFENTNNKKKRKIPTSGNIGNHHSTLSAEMAHMGISSHRDIDVMQADADGGVGQYYGTGNSAIPAGASGNGVSGAGRGRYGRVALRNFSGRSPLAVSMNGPNALQSSRMLSQRREHIPSAKVGTRESLAISDQGIISTAIANAAALPATIPRGQENISLLGHQSSKKSTSTRSQFTFTIESDSAKSLAWSGQHNQNSTASPYSYLVTASASTINTQTATSHSGVATHGTQTSPSMTNQPNQAAHQNSRLDQQNSRQGKKPRRPSARQYSLAARQRRLRQDYNNYHHPPNPEDVWICEFCEYESIFGSPPEALIRQYEIKDRRERRLLEEKRRLLEKAKMKGRKGKKGNKAATKNVNATSVPQQTTPKTRYESHPVDRTSTQHHGTQSEDYLGDDYDDDSTPVSALPNRAPAKIPLPVAHGHDQVLRSAVGSRTTNRLSEAG